MFIYWSQSFDCFSLIPSDLKRFSFSWRYGCCGSCSMKGILTSLRTLWNNHSLRNLWTALVTLNRDWWSSSLLRSMVHGWTIVQMGHGISTWVPSRVNWEELPLLHWSSSKGWLPRADRLPRGPGDHSVWSLAMKCLCRVVGMPGCSPLQLKWNKEEQWRWFGLLTAGAALHVITGCLSGDLLSFVNKIEHLIKYDIICNLSHFVKKRLLTWYPHIGCKEEANKNRHK